MSGGFSFDLDAMRARDEINDALSVMKTGAPPMPRLPMPQMGMPQPQMPPMQPQMAQMRPQMAQMQPQMAQMGAQMGQMRPQMPQMGAPLGQMGAMRPPMAPQMGPPLRFKRGGHVSGDDFAVKRDEYASGGGAWTRKEGKNPEGGLNAKGRPYVLPMGCFISPEIDNLLPACKNISATHLAAASARVHPTEWLIGEVAALIASQALRTGRRPRALHDDPVAVRAFQHRLHEAGIPTEWDPALTSSL